MVKAVYPGSFDPVTLGHLDIIRRASGLVDELIIGILVNKNKHPLFSKQERYEMLADAVKDLPNVRIETFDGLVVDFAAAHEARIIIRGLRAVTDYEIEMQTAQTNRTIRPEVETMFLITSLEYAFLSSTVVKEIASFEGDISHYVTPLVAEKMRQRFATKVQPKPPVGNIAGGIIKC